MRDLCRGGTVVLGMLAACLLGCGRGGSDIELKNVSGTVTLDGQPLPDASVTYTPKGGGRPAMATTDSSGHYELEYSTTGEGAPPGEYVVAIRTFREAAEDPGTGLMIEAVPEKVPTAYNSPSTLMVTVPSESYDFDLKSTEGELVQPEILGEDSE